MAPPGYSSAHPVFATTTETGEVIHARLFHRAANTQRGATCSLSMAIARCWRAGLHTPTSSWAPTRDS